MIEVLPMFARKITSDNPDIKIIVDKFDSGPPVDAAIEYSIVGPDMSILRALGKKPLIYYPIQAAKKSKQLMFTHVKFRKILKNEKANRALATPAH